VGSSQVSGELEFTSQSVVAFIRLDVPSLVADSEVQPLQS
jgi:hypothetical protein